MTFKKINAWLHLWLGLLSGIVVFIVSITGCIYVFENEIKDLIEKWRFVTPQETTFLQPTQLTSIAHRHLKDGQNATGVSYHGRSEAAIVTFFSGRPEGEKKPAVKQQFGNKGAMITVGDKQRGKGGKDKKAGERVGGKHVGKFTSVYMNQYTGEILKVKTVSRGGGSDAEFDFFRFILNGHRALWLPYNIGRPIVGGAVLIFVFLLISGIVLWWPTKWKNKAIRDKSFKIKWSGSFKRVNYDFHNVLGFYSMLILVVISLTGLVWSFQWFSKSLYWVTSGGKSLEQRRRPLSDTTQLAAFEPSSVDIIWQQLPASQKSSGSIYLSIPRENADVISATVYHVHGAYYKSDQYFFDQYTLKEVKSASPFAGKYSEASIPDKIRRMNYDLHVGAILGISGKIIAFIASLISASLPITGFLIWWNKRKKGKKGKEKKKAESSTSGTLMQPQLRRPVVQRPKVLKEEIAV
ncbi:PepSY-associated TM helix domain-containing protein [Desertivirga xinjiangensis]|uniref:PepSY-associated TM helix domain-containing protein n=1 Tax=Desertivirga xinjiangensis TaxID=539206 RepID=UPI00210919C6|nr:PepSY-associated TM helix domain-containing protein [Pedobacter xinjiangensis]